MKVAVVIITYNVSSRIFILQVQAIQKFCKDDFDIQVFDNSTDQPIYEQIKYHAEQLGLNYTKTFAGGKGSSDSHAFAANFAYQQVKDKYKFVFFMDHDLIPVIEFSVIEILSGGHVMAGLGQGAKKKYMWAGAVMLANERIDTSIVDFKPSSEFNLDSGGNLYKIVDKYGDGNCIFFNEAYHQNPYFNGTEYNSFAMIKDGTFMHFTAASNWCVADRHEERMNSLINIAKEKTGL